MELWALLNHCGAILILSKVKIIHLIMERNWKEVSKYLISKLGNSANIGRKIF